MTRTDRGAFSALALFLIVSALLWLTETDAAPASVFSACRQDAPLVVLDVGADGPRVVDAPSGDPLSWDAERGFDWPPGVTGRGWLVAVYADGGVLYAWLVGDRSGQRYALVTDDLSEYVAGYGGAAAWHVRCGGWRLT